MREISFEETYSIDNPVFIDVRAPVEYNADHIPGSINMPVFDNDERSEIGKIYKMIGKDEAIVKGSEIAGMKLGEFVAGINKLPGKNIIITCFRGGMRSTTIASLLDSLGFSVYKLKDGYKGYRRFISARLEKIELNPPAFIIFGLTGTGKTEILNKIKNSIDLEGMAGHRSSVFGAIGLRPHTQKMFESLLMKRIDDLNNSEFALIEGESRKIGDIHIPRKIMRIINEAPAILIKASMERRIEIILKNYSGQDGNDILSIVNSLEPRIGRKNVLTLEELFKSGDLFEFTRILLEKYYDPLYMHTIEKINYITEIENTDSNSAAVKVEESINNYLQNIWR